MQSILYSAGNLLFTESSLPANMNSTEDIITSTMVERMHMLASPTAFFFILYIMPEMLTK